METRKQVEASFHDRRAIDKQTVSPEEFERKYSNKKLYSVTRRHRLEIERWVTLYCHRGAVALDFCCGEGDGALRMSRTGATVYAVDISAESIRLAQQACARLGVAPVFRVMDAERLEFPDNYFDLIYAAGCLHHLDLGNAYREFRRVLKPSGRIICNEALAHNPVFHLYRKMTPRLRTPWEVPHILRVPDILRAKEFFKRIDIRFYYLASLLAVPLRQTRLFEPVLGALEATDQLLLSIPGVRRLAWQCTFELSVPRNK